MKKIALLITGLFFAWGAFANTGVPQKMKFADLNLSLNNGARNYIADFIAKLKKSPTYFNKLVDRAALYMPMVDQAFDEVGTPTDLKYIIIQESSINGDAVSKSGAVGYWQIKEPAAREVGLTINKYVDERRHIYRSSFGAASYFKQINTEFDNWIYAVIGYNRGPVGALDYIDKREFGSKSLTLTQHTHPYALKALAFKLTFENAILERPSSEHLQMLSTKGESQVKKLAATHGMSLDEFKSYNRWIKGDRLPQGNTFQYIVKGTGKVSPPLADQTKPPVKPSTPSPPPPTQVRTDRQTGKFTYLSPKEDPEYGEDYVIVQPGEQLVEIAVRNDTKLKRLHKYNGTSNTRSIRTGTLIYLRERQKMTFHIASAGESWKSIAELYETDVEKLHKKNRTNRLGSKIWPGQKIYLKSKKPKDEKILILEALPLATETEKASPTPSSAVKEVKTEVAQPKNIRKRSSSQVYQIHTVRAGETLWSIGQRYKTSVEDIRRINKLSSNEIRVGQQLKVPQL